VGEIKRWPPPAAFAANEISVDETFDKGANSLQPSKPSAVPFDAVVLRHAQDASSQPLVEAYSALLLWCSLSMSLPFSATGQGTRKATSSLTCTAGKDRTGVVAALVGLHLGTSDEEIANDYALSEIGCMPGQKLLVGFLRSICSNNDQYPDAMRGIGGARCLPTLKLFLLG
jgi:hypothetical protein